MILIGVALVLMVINMVLLVGVVFDLSSTSQQNARQAHIADETHAAVCVYRSQLKTELMTGEKYLLQHPNGVPSLHLSAAQLEQTIEREQVAVQGLSGLNCQS